MLGRRTTEKIKNQADLATSLAKDRKFRRELLSAIGHGTKAQRRASRKLGFIAAATRIGTDPKLKREVARMVSSLDRAWQRVEKKRSHRLRNTFLVLGGVGGAIAAALPLRRKLSGETPSFGTTSTAPRTIEESIEVNVPVSTAYNQWTQFEDFPLFMEGVDHVQQLDDTRLHWAATVAGKKAEWDAKILEQRPDQQISWISEDGKKTRGTVTFEPRDDAKTLVRLSMSYQAEGPAETLGSAAGLDSRRVRSDLERFKELIESRGSESGAWRGEIRAGEKKK
jgi:uncharacterized membrane protein